MNLSNEIIKEIVYYGTLATSADNCQPWLFNWDGNKLEVMMDKDRSGFFYDVNHESTYLTLGAASENITIAASHFNLKTDIELNPEIKSSNEVVAHIRFIETDEKENKLFVHLDKRTINRNPFKKAHIPTTTLEELEKDIYSKYQINMTWFNSEQEKKILQSIVYNADKILFEDERLHSGLFKWIWTDKKDEGRLDGMTLDEIGLTFIQKPFFRLLGNWKSMSKLNKLGLSCLPAINSINLLKSSPTYCLMSVNNRDMESYFEAGMAFERLWIKATALGLAIQPMAGFVFLMNHYFINSAEKFSYKHKKIISRDTQTLLKTINSDKTLFPCMFFRLGYPNKLTDIRSKRRKIDSVLCIT